MKLDFYYWSYQCPINRKMLKLLTDYHSRLEIRTFDISLDTEKAKEMNMFFPALSVVDNRHRYFSPLSRNFLGLLCSGIIPKESPYSPVVGTKKKSGSIVPITPENYETAGACTAGKCHENCVGKIRFLRAQGLSVFGFMNLGENGKLLGGAEYLPSVRVPYDIPKDDRTAFLTFVYLSDPVYDYKSAPLLALENYLRSCFDRIIAVSDEAGIFPNGDMAFFKRNAYSDREIISEEKVYCTLHLMGKNLV